MPERPRLALETRSTNNTSYEDVIKLQLSPDIKGVSFLTLAIDPDPNARYRIIIARLLIVVDLELTAVWSISLPHLTSGVYEGFKPGDWIIIQHKSISSTVTVKTGATLQLNEVVK
ncbi:MAG: hypothetical protein QW618_03200 [Nitrososphaerales archaeon]